MSVSRVLAIAGALAVGGCCLAGCGNDDCSAAGTCSEAPVDGGASDATTDGSLRDGTTPTDTGTGTDAAGDAAGDAGDAMPPPTCDFSVDPVEALCVTDALGIFVSASGTATGAGTKESPVSTIAKGLALSSSGTSHVYVCSGTYAENVTLSGTSAASLQGGFDCTSWSYASTNKVTVAPSTGIALTVNQVTSATAIEDMEFDAAAGTPTSVNSIAALVNASPSVTMRRVVLMAAAGGTPANPAAPGTNHTSDPLDGHSAGATGPAGTMCKATCGDATTSTGGAGGDSADAPGTGLPSLGAGAGGANNLACNLNGANGGDGNPASTPSINAPAPHAGSLTSTGWVPSAGTLGTNGAPGQGGGGGGDKSTAGFGGGGACGGCGGAGGAAGAGGGGSIALLTVSSAVTLGQCTLTSAAAGSGATGSGAEVGQSGGTIAGSGTAGCSGGAGGSGAGGNGGGSGAGGVSFGLLFSGVAPTLDGVAAATSATHAGITIGTSGTPGPASSAGPAATGGNPGNAGAAGPAGVAAAIQQYESLP